MKRYRSIDILRGFCMIFVLGMDQVIRKGIPYFNATNLQFFSNQMKHSEFGMRITFADIVLPTLVFISGLTIPISLKKHEDEPWRYKLLLIAKRVVLLLLFSLIYNAPINISLGSNHLTIAGVLSVFAVAWGSASLIYFLILNACKNNKRKLEIGLIITAVVIQIIYSAVTMFLHAPDFPEADVFSAQGNIVCYLDRIFYPQELLVNGLFYRCGFAYFSSIAMAILGIIIGIKLYGADHDTKYKIRIAVIGIIMIMSGILLRYVYPFNKRLWSPTFILFVAGIDTLILVFLNKIIESRKWKRKYLFESFGHNTIALYLLEGSGVFFSIGVFLFSVIFIIFNIGGDFYEQVAEFLVICIVNLYMANKNIKINV